MNPTNERANAAEESHSKENEKAKALQKEQHEYAMDNIKNEARKNGYDVGYNDAKFNKERMRKAIKEMPFPRDPFSSGYLKGIRAWQYELAQDRKKELKHMREAGKYHQRGRER